MTREELDQTASLYESGKTIAEVQAALGLGYHAVRYRVVKAGASLRRPSESATGNQRRAQSMKAFWADPDARERMIDSIKGAHPKCWSDEDDRRLMELSAQKVPGRIIAKRLGRTHCAVRDRLKRLRKRARAMS